jgi:hypothetical protein
MGISRSYIVLHLPPFTYSTYPLSRPALREALAASSPFPLLHLPPFPSRIAGGLGRSFPRGGRLGRGLFVREGCC